ncbi:MAG: hypothetical protein QNK23_16615 [Crocinitomicaceae bacterium]|nr:hypothetical protein [Crocinitomicaceae bacterium]
MEHETTTTMMKKITKASLLLAMSLVFFGCKKEGCMDEAAFNYDPSANESTTCDYNANVLFWMTETTANTLNADGYAMWGIYIDGVLMETNTAATFHSSAPPCGTASSFFIEFSGNSNKVVQYEFISNSSIPANDNVVFASGYIDLQGGECNQIQIFY